MLKIIAQAQMVRQSDGSYAMVTCEHLNVTADALARFIWERASGGVEIVEVSYE